MMEGMVSSGATGHAAAERFDRNLISDRDFVAVRRFVYAELGVWLSDAKRALVVSRLSARLRALELRTFRDYVTHAESDRPERQRLFDAITTNETRFFREPAHFDFIRAQLLPGLRSAAEEGSRPGSSRIWSAGCSSGEEPYSLAMTLLDQLPPASGWSHQILATDVSARALDKAVAGVYPDSRRSDIPPRLLKSYMMKGVRERAGSIAAGPEIRAIIHFAAVNLNDVTTYPNGVFDAILCRNVLIYFDATSRERVLNALLARLAPGGFLFLGHAESINGRAAVRSVIPNVYVKTP